MRRISARRHPMAKLSLSLLTLMVVAPWSTATSPPNTGDASLGGLTIEHPILFVTQFPIAQDFATIGSTFANHFARQSRAGRGGDLYIVYPTGELCNLTATNGYGDNGSFQGYDSIAVRDPHVHWDGTKALFSMTIGSAETQYEQLQTYWQMYEVTGLESCAATDISKVANQPVDYNNVTPIYSPDGTIVFSSDRPRSGERHLYPQRDEYESTPTVVGLYSLDPATGVLDLLNHSPSGVFTPSVDSYGRILFTRWDHLQRDQQAEDCLPPSCQEPVINPNGAFNWASEAADAPTLERLEVFPEPRTYELAGPDVNGLRFNLFTPWQILPDGSEEETLNHIGRHELQSYFNQSFPGDSNLIEFISSVSGRFNANEIGNFFQLAEDPAAPGTYYGTDAPEFGSHASGGIIRLTAPPTLPADQIAVDYVTDPVTRDIIYPPDPAPAGHSGHYRDPRPLADGRLIAAHATELGPADDDGPSGNNTTQPRYDFRIKQLSQSGNYLAASTPLLPAPIVRQVEFWDPDALVTYDGPMWELSPVEVRARPVPPVLSAQVPAPEAQVFADEGVDVDSFRQDLRDRQLALVVSRDVTTRDTLDRQQPFNLRVPGGVQTTGAGGTIYDVAHLQFFQGDQVRGLGGPDDADSGRRVLAQVMHDPEAINPPTNGPQGSVELATDGSMAALVPAHRAMTWQLTDPQGEPVVRERYWLTFQPGEVRVCASCHGLNSVDQAGSAAPNQPPEALRSLLRFWQGQLFTDGFETGDPGRWSSAIGD